MPQFDLFTFSAQIFWALFFFIFLYLSFIYYLIPSISTTLKVRSRRLRLQNAAQTFSAVSVSENDPLDLYIGGNLHLESILSTGSDYKLLLSYWKFMDSLSLGNTLEASLQRFKLHNGLKGFKSFLFSEACLFH
uniref:ATP synthase F0 subunit 8 n=1 Tax=Phaeocystis globosa TaxID=33658 RepID=A0A8A1RXM9_9EUKA|nr:ATP synthase F0 subunit 8 [Phaeocystis globosa]QST19719.1 ATP synthase F0 subunit 8 [Phaeocystis globosa]